MNNNKDMDRSDVKGANELPGGWTCERFKIIDAGNGEIAFWSTIHKRFVQMKKRNMKTKNPDLGDEVLKPTWTWERFTVVDAGGGQVAFHNKKWNRFIRLNNGGMDSSDKK